jgi:integral membrane sensor domain MASE1
MLKKWVLPTLLVGMLYAAASELALQLLRYAAETAVVWFASGVGLAAMLLLGTRALPGVLLGTLLCGLMAGKPAAMLLATSALTTGQIWLSWWLLVRVAGFDRAMERVRDMMKLAFIGATVSPLLNAARVFLEHRFRTRLRCRARAGQAALLARWRHLLLVPAVLARAPRGSA